ncbi:hypothetical protein SLS55_005999 [Diplodia seriata]|uniref:Uncharacterized protein n=1 Tax=Diplodia seriata TaxID=420778 RepID=A0ABR3CGC4_9PEZI
MNNPTSATPASATSTSTSPSASTTPSSSTAPKKRSHHAAPFSTVQRPKKHPRRRSTRALSPNSLYARTAPPVTTSNWAPAGQVEREVDERTRQYWEVQANGHQGAFFLPPYDGSVEGAPAAPTTAPTTAPTVPTVPTAPMVPTAPTAPPMVPMFRQLTPPPPFTPLPPLERLVLPPGEGREVEALRRRMVDDRRRLLDERDAILRERGRVLDVFNQRFVEQSRQMRQIIEEQDRRRQQYEADQKRQQLQEQERRRQQYEAEKRQQTDVQGQQQSLADQSDRGQEQGQPDQSVQQQGQQAADGTQAEAEDGDGAGKSEDEDQDDIEYLTDIVTGEINPTGFFHGTAGVTPYEYWLLPYQQDRPRR